MQLIPLVASTAPAPDAMLNQRIADQLVREGEDAMNDAGRERSVSNSGLLPFVVIAVPSTKAASWEHQLVSRLCSSGMCETQLWDVSSTDGSAGVPPDVDKVTAIVDLTGRLDASWHCRALEGIWRVCDERGVPLGDECHGLETIASGVGVNLHLVAIREGSSKLIDSASAYAEPNESVSMDRLRTFAETLLLAALREICVLGALEARPEWKASGARPTLLQRRLWQVRGRINQRLRRLAQILLVEQWMVGVVDMPLAEALRAKRLPVRWIGQRVSSHYWADPFGVPGREDEIYCEEYDVERGVGRIVKLKLNGLVVSALPEPVNLGLPGHLSYPYLFRHAGALYCVAESAQSRRCVLNRQDEQGQWREVAVLLSGVAAADPTIFEHNGYFWLAYTDVAAGPFDNLCLCYARELHGPWFAHPQNPVKVNHGSARSGGSVIRDGDELLRVAQVCTSGYGQAIAINRIAHCTPDFYREEVVRIVTPRAESINPHGLHTMSGWGDRTLVDGKRYEVNVSVVARKIAARVRRAFALL